MMQGLSDTLQRGRSRSVKTERRAKGLLEIEVRLQGINFPKIFNEAGEDTLRTRFQKPGSPTRSTRVRSASQLNYTLLQMNCFGWSQSDAPPLQQ